MGLFTFWFEVLLSWGLGGALMAFAGVGLVCLGCPWLKVFIRTLKMPFWMLGGIGTLLTCAGGWGSGGPLLDFQGSMQLLVSSHVRDRDKALLRGTFSGGVWNGFLFGKVQGENVPCRFCGGLDGDGHLF